jgi:hypothetical protein
MLLIRFNQDGVKRIVDLQDMLTGQTALLMGGAPSLAEQPLRLLEQRGVVSMAMNNAATHFRPTLWASGDRPECYEPRVLLDPTIMKFGILSHAQVELDERYGNRRYYQMPNQLFYIPEDNVPWDEYLAVRRGVPWYNNTLFVSIHILYQLGIRRIILGGSDFGFSKSGDMYAHRTELGAMEHKWNSDLYNSLVHELRRLRPVFDKAGLEFLDCSVNSRLGQTYPHITLEKAVELCLERFPAQNLDPAVLPHCSKFAPESIQDKIAQWPGYQVLGAQPVAHRRNDGLPKQVL